MSTSTRSSAARRGSTAGSRCRRSSARSPSSRTSSGLEARFFQSNHEGEYVEELHRSSDYADGLVLNPGAWTHYAWALRDAVEVAGLPAVEIHLSDIENREEWRRHSVLADVVIARVSGLGPEGYRVALQHLKDAL